MKSKGMRSIPRKLTFPDVNFIQTAPSSSGKTKLLKHLNGDRLSRNDAIAAKCCDCMGYYIDGREDCELVECSLYPFMPYMKNRG